MENVVLNIEMLPKRMDALQSLINTQNDLLLSAHDLMNVTTMRSEIDEEKIKNRKFEIQIMIYSI